MSSDINRSPLEFSHIAHRSKLMGELSFFGITRLSCSVDGSVSMEEKHLLVIESDAQIKGKIFCHNLEVFGRIEGEINATGKVILYPPASIEGSIGAENLIIHPGALVNISANTLNS